VGKTSIEWTDASWNPIVGCTEVSPEIQKVEKYRFERRSIYWTGEVRFLPERLEEPLHWKKPQRIFVCDMGDLFHEGVRDEWLLQTFQTMARAPQHTYQILTKRAVHMHEWVKRFDSLDVIHPMRATCSERRWPWSNVWLGVSVENQHFADERIPWLLQTPAAVRWISAEPLLESIDIRPWLTVTKQRDRMLDWVVCGGESGPSARPMHVDWVRSLRFQCVGAGVPFFFKQWGEWLPPGQEGYCVDNTTSSPIRIGKKCAGCVLDGRTWHEFPKGATV
jgi:protein gp37